MSRIDKFIGTENNLCCLREDGRIGRWIKGYKIYSLGGNETILELIM